MLSTFPGFCCARGVPLGVTATMIVQEIWLNLRKYHSKHLIILCRICKNFRRRDVTQEDGSTIRKWKLAFLINPVLCSC